MNRRAAPLDAALANVGARVRELRVLAGLSQEDIGRPYLTRGAVSSIEHGRSMPSLRSLAYLAKQLHVPLREFFPRGD